MELKRYRVHARWTETRIQGNKRARSYDVAVESRGVHGFVTSATCSHTCDTSAKVAIERKKASPTT